jgi:hypothetical protein
MGENFIPTQNEENFLRPKKKKKKKKNAFVKPTEDLCEISGSQGGKNKDDSLPRLHGTLSQKAIISTEDIVWFLHLAYIIIM